MSDKAARVTFLGICAAFCGVFMMVAAFTLGWFGVVFSGVFAALLGVRAWDELTDDDDEDLEGEES